MCSLSGKYLDGATEITEMATYVDFDYHVIMGRRGALSEEEQRVRTMNSTFSGPQIATYDRLLDMAKRCDKAEAEMAQQMR
jgi:hypothetical protein